MIILFLANIPRNISKIINFVNLMFLSFNIILNLSNNSIFDTKKKTLLNEMIIYEDDIIKKFLINFIKKFSIL